MGAPLSSRDASRNLPSSSPANRTVTVTPGPTTPSFRGASPTRVYNTQGEVDSLPAVANGVVYFSSDPYTHAFSLPGSRSGGVRRPDPASLRSGLRLQPAGH